MDDVDLPLFIEVSTSCETGSKTNQERLVVYVPTRYLADTVANKLCQDSVVAKQYGVVKVYWGYQLGDSIEFLGKGIANLILAKENMMHAFMGESTYNYQPVIGYPAYTAFFISGKEKPRLEKSYFLDKRIGLLDYPTSRSGHILPKRLFKQLDLNIDGLDIVYASSHEELRELLAGGEVDLIASYWRDDDQQRFSKNYITSISDSISGSKWYLKMDAQNTDLLCSIQNSLLDMAREQGSNYFQHAETYWRCEGQAVTYKEPRNDEL